MIFPNQLQRKEFRFVLIRPKMKSPFEFNWQKRNNYIYNHPKITTYKNAIGIVSGYGGLVVLDIDDVKLIEEFDKKTKTFSVKTGSGKRHYYFICKDKFLKSYYILGEDAGELRVANSQVLIPGSLHPSGNKYEVFNNIPIREVTKKELRELLGELLTKKNEVIDTTRSGVEWGEVCSMVEGGYSFDDCDKEMKLLGFTKWIEAGIAYRLHTYCSALKKIKSCG